MQGFASDAEYIGGFRFIPVISCERFHDDVPFRFGEGSADLMEEFCSASRTGSGKSDRRMVSSELITTALSRQFLSCRILPGQS